MRDGDRSAGGGKLWLGLGAVAVLLVLGAGTARRGLFETSEGRYGSLAAEMVRSGDYLVPRLNGVKRFEKPPLSMWAMAASVRVLGESEGALRLPGVLAALAGVVAALVLAGGLRPSGLWAAALTTAAPLYFALAKSLTTDIYLACFAALALVGVVRGWESPDRRRWWHALAAISVGLGFLTKGPVILVLVLVPALGEAVWSRRRDEIRGLLSPLNALLFVGVAAPWFVAVGMKEPGLLEWFVKERAVNALVSSRGFHAGPFFYYLPVFLWGFLPGSMTVLGAGRGAWAEMLARRRGRLLVLAALAPLVMFTLSASKLATYVLPSVVPTCALAGMFLERGTRRAVVLTAGLMLATIGLAVVGSQTLGWLGNRVYAIPPDAVRLVVLAGGLGGVAAVGALMLSLTHRARAALVLLLGGQVGALLLAQAGALRVESLLGSSRELVVRADALRDPDMPLVCYRGFLRSIPFYTGSNAVIVKWYRPKVIGREQFEEVGLASLEQMRALLGRGRTGVITERKYLPELLRELPGLKLRFDDGHYVLLESEPRAFRAAPQAESP